MVVSAKLKRQTLINEKKMQQLMNDIKKDVVRRTQNAKDLNSWIAQCGGYVTSNPLVNGGVMASQVDEIVKSITKATTISKLPRGAHQELVKGVMSDNTMHYVTKMGEDMKTDLRKIAVNAYTQNSKANILAGDKIITPNDLAKQMSDKIDSLSNARAKVIARTETNRASVLSDYTNAKLNMGAQSFIVVSDMATVCQKCTDAYDNGGIVFDISQNDMLPPFHPNCNCSPRFQMKSVDDMISDDPSLSAY